MPRALAVTTALCCVFRGPLALFGFIQKLVNAERILLFFKLDGAGALLALVGAREALVWLEAVGGAELLHVCLGTKALVVLALLVVVHCRGRRPCKQGLVVHVVG